MSNDKVPMTANNILKNNLEQFSLSVMLILINNFYNNITLVHLACICFLEQEKKKDGG